MPLRELSQLNLPNVAKHNTSFLINYYTKKQYIFYKKIKNSNFTLEQTRDTRYIPLPLTIPLAHILTNESNSKKDIRIDTYAHTHANTHTHTQNNVAHIYEETRNHLITIPIGRLKWLWKQYTQLQNRPHRSIPPTQPFETKIVWLYQRYKYRIPKNDPLKYSNYSIPKIILDDITTSINITHLYFSLPIPCSILIKESYLPFSRDKIFGDIRVIRKVNWSFPHFDPHFRNQV